MGRRCGGCIRGGDGGAEVEEETTAEKTQQNNNGALTSNNKAAMTAQVQNCQNEHNQSKNTSCDCIASY